MERRRREEEAVRENARREQRLADEQSRWNTAREAVKKRAAEREEELYKRRQEAEQRARARDEEIRKAREDARPVRPDLSERMPPPLTTAVTLIIAAIAGTVQTGRSQND